jgi:predicted RNA-binding protein
MGYIRKLKSYFSLTKIINKRNKKFEEKVEFLNQLIKSINKSFGYTVLFLRVRDDKSLFLMHKQKDNLVVSICQGRIDIIESTIIGIMIGLSWASERTRKNFDKKVINMEK